MSRVVTVLLSAAALACAEDSTFTYYLPKTSLRVELKVMKEEKRKAEFGDLTKLFFPEAEDSAIRLVDETTYSVGKDILIKAVGSPDLGQKVTLQTKGSFKDISAVFNFDETGNVSSLDYSYRDTKWDFLLGLLKSAVGIVAPEVASTSVNSLGVAPTSRTESSSCKNEKDDLSKIDREVLDSKVLRQPLDYAYCKVPPDFRSRIRELNDSDSRGYAAFVEHFKSETANPVGFRPKESPDQKKVNGKLAKFFKAWRLARELDLIQASRERYLTDRSAAPDGAEGLLLIFAKQDERLEAIGAAFFGETVKSVYWNPTFAVDLASDHKSIQLLGLDRKTGPCRLTDNGVRSLVPWPKGTKDCEFKKDSPQAQEAKDKKQWLVPTVDLQLEARGAGNACAEPEKKGLWYYVPKLYSISLKTKENAEGNAQEEYVQAMADVFLTQGAACEWIELRDKSHVAFSLDPTTGALKSLTISSNPAVATDIAGQITDMAKTITAAREAAAKAPLNKLADEVRAKALRDCLAKEASTSGCAAFLK